MNRGRLIAVDTPAALRQRMEEPLFRIRTDDAPRAVDALGGDDSVLEAGMFGRDIHVVLRDAARADGVRAGLEARGLAVRSVERIEPALEDVFVALVRREGGARED